MPACTVCLCLSRFRRFVDFIHPPAGWLARAASNVLVDRRNIDMPAGSHYIVPSVVQRFHRHMLFDAPRAEFCEQNCAVAAVVALSELKVRLVGTEWNPDQRSPVRKLFQVQVPILVLVNLLEFIPEIIEKYLRRSIGHNARSVSVQAEQVKRSCDCGLDRLMRERLTRYWSSFVNSSLPMNPSPEVSAAL
jgi:hypothetical protein